MSMSIGSTLDAMSKELEDVMEEMGERKEKGSKLKDLYRLALVIVGVIAVVQELRKPAEDRTWHGKVASIIPYDFRIPTFERLRDTYWNPEGPLVSGKAFGIGWALNLGAVKKLLGR